jgi:hypothetical protein
METKEKFQMLCDLTFKLTEMKFNKEPELKIGECSASVLHQLMKASCATPIIVVPMAANQGLKEEAMQIAKSIADGVEYGRIPDNMKLIWGWA